MYAIKVGLHGLAAAVAALLYRLLPEAEPLTPEQERAVIEQGDNCW